MINSIMAGEINSSFTGSITVGNSGSISCDPSSYNTSKSYSTNWDEILQNLHSNSITDNKIDDEEIKKKISEKINEVLNEDDTIEIMKKYLLRFIEENIDNPENLIKEFLTSRDEELNKCKEELKDCKKEIEMLRNAIMQPYTTNPYIPYPPSPYMPLTSISDITWINNTSTSC